MLVNADFSRPAFVGPDDHRWVDSPQPGVERMMLDRLGGESARATSLVRYAPASTFPAHHHPGGEEILVLSGTFSEDGVDYPAGWYLLSPPGSSHRPSSAQGALIFVKLRHMDAREDRRVRIDTRDPSAWSVGEDGRSRCPLFSEGTRRVSIERLVPGEAPFTAGVPGAELLVVRGELRRDGRRWREGSWIRLPAGEHRDLSAGEHGAEAYLSVGPLPRDGAGHAEPLAEPLAEPPAAPLAAPPRR